MRVMFCYMTANGVHAVMSDVDNIDGVMEQYREGAGFISGFSAGSPFTFSTEGMIGIMPVSEGIEDNPWMRWGANDDK